MNKEDIIEIAEQELLHTYNKYQIVLEKGEGVYLFDTRGNKYLDFTAGISVMAFGYGNQEYNEALKNQIDKIIHTSNLYYNEPIVQAADKILKISKMDRIFFTNSGAEAIEGALKAAKKYAYEKDKKTNHEIIAMQHSFHGRTIGALSVTGNEHYREAFEPLMPNVKFATYNDIDSVKNLVNDRTCAILLETVQGEGGIYPADPKFIKEIRKICDERDILLILDEIQCGMGRSGEMFAWMNYGVKPDIMASAKALGCGVPVGAFLMTQKVANQSLQPGDHGTTYGGNPLVGAAVSKVADMMESYQIPKHVKEVSNYLEEQLKACMKEYSCIKAWRGLGLLQGLEFDIPAIEISNKALEKGLILITAGANVIRFVPPLIIEKEHIDKMIFILKDVLYELEKEKEQHEVKN